MNNNNHNFSLCLSFFLSFSFSFFSFLFTHTDWTVLTSICACMSMFWALAWLDRSGRCRRCQMQWTIATRWYSFLPFQLFPNAVAHKVRVALEMEWLSWFVYKALTLPSQTPDNAYDFIVQLIENLKSKKKICLFTPSRFTVETPASNQHALASAEFCSLLQTAIRTQLFGLSRESDHLPIRLNFQQKGGRIAFLNMLMSSRQVGWP